MFAHAGSSDRHQSKLCHEPTELHDRAWATGSKFHARLSAA
jgi:hypothetical protein